MISVVVLPSVMRRSTWFRVGWWHRMRTRATRHKALLASRSPPRCSRCRSVRPELTGIGAAPQSRANAASERSGRGCRRRRPATARRQAPTGEVRVPGILVDAIVVAPDQLQTTQIEYDPALSGQQRRSLDDVEPVEFGLEKVIARRAAAELSLDATVNLGFGVSAAVPRILLEEGHAEDVTWLIEQGAVGGFPLTGFAFGCALNPQALMQSIDQFTQLQGGGFDVAMLSFLEVSAAGDVNVSFLPSRPHVTAGVGGFADIVTRAPRIVFSGYFTAGRKDIRIDDGRLAIVEDGRVPKFVPEVSQITFSGDMARRRGQQVIYVTERCVLELRPEGLTVIEIAPGVDLERDVLAAAGFTLRVSDDLRLMPSALFRPEPIGLVLQRQPSRLSRLATPLAG
jgi:propionate CoA-transferase